jgi:hypothetical protein
MSMRVNELKSGGGLERPVWTSVQARWTSVSIRWTRPHTRLRRHAEGLGSRCKPVLRLGCQFPTRKDAYKADSAATIGGDSMTGDEATFSEPVSSGLSSENRRGRRSYTHAFVIYVIYLCIPVIVLSSWQTPNPGSITSVLLDLTSFPDHTQ